MKIRELLRRGYITTHDMHELANCFAWAIVILAAGCGVIYYVAMRII